MNNTAPTVAKMFKDRKPYFHFSIDDAHRVLRSPRSPAFRFLRSLFDEFGLVTSLYLFTNPEQKFSSWLSSLPKSSLRYPWLRYGPHATDWNHPLNMLNAAQQVKHVDDFYKHVMRLAGREYFAPSVRLHYYQGSRDVCERLYDHGVRAIFTADFHHTKLSYNLGPQERDATNEYGHFFDPKLKLYYVKTSLRIENRPRYIQDAREYLAKHGQCVVFTHEIELTKPVIQRRIRALLNYFKDKKINLAL